MSVAVKICGLNDAEAVRAVAKARAEYAGFVHFPGSPRHISLESAAKLKHELPDSIRSVSVLVDPADALLEAVAGILNPDFVQLHGNEAPARLAAIGQEFPSFKLIKAIAVRTAEDISQAERFYEAADMLMFDAKPSTPALPGGNGVAFDWRLLAGKQFPLPWFLSGGLNVGNLREALAQSGAAMVDISSGVERAPGVKDAGLIDAFVKAAHHET